MIVDDRTIDALGAGQRHVPDELASRLLYLGDAGLQNWLAVVRESGYPLQGHDRCRVRMNCLAAIQNIRASRFVSLGPGEGLHDLELVHALVAKQDRVSYVPVDISCGLLDIAIHNLRDHVDVPFAMQCDFECGLGFVRATLDRYAPRESVLFSLLGGTVGNLDLGLVQFFEAFRRVLNPGDSWLLDVPLAGPAWQAGSEPRLNKTSYTPAFRRFVAGGVVRAGAAICEEDILDDFDERLDLSLSGDDEVDGTRVVTVRDIPSSRVILRFRRFRWQSFLDWLRTRGFTIPFAECSISSDQDTFGMGVVLLRSDGKSPAD